MVKFRSNAPSVRPSVRQSNPQPTMEFLEPADSFDLGEDAASAEAAAGEWLGRKAAAKSRKKKSLKEKTARGAAASAAGKGPSATQAADGSRVSAFSQNAGEANASSGSASPASDTPLNSTARADSSSEQGSASSGRPSRKGSVAKPQSHERRNHILKIVALCFAAVLVACAAVAAFWAWDTWLRFDDAADIQGEWLTADGTAFVVIDAEEIHMPDSVDFAYTLDTKGKTISYSFVDLAGGGSYEFSRDRATLTITESDGSQTVLQKYSDSTDGEPRVLSADEAAVLRNAAGQNQENAEAQGNGESSESAPEASAETSEEAAVDSGQTAEAPEESTSSTSAVDEEENAKIAEALNSNSGDLTPGSNAVKPGAMGAASGA